jgi:hypothetical protein
MYHTPFKKRDAERMILKYYFHPTRKARIISEEAATYSEALT